MVIIPCLVLLLYCAVEVKGRFREVLSVPRWSAESNVACTCGVWFGCSGGVGGCWSWNSIFLDIFLDGGVSEMLEGVCV